jgi:membrane fusion protein (multidrug efflux system)
MPDERSTDRSEAEHDRKSAADADVPPGAPRVEQGKSESPEAFGRGRNGQVERPPEAFGRGKPAERRKKQEDDAEKADSNEEEKANPDHQKQGKDKGDGEKDVPPKKPPFYKRPVPMILLGAILLVLIVGGILLWLYLRQFESTDDAFIDGRVVQISPKLAEVVKAVHVDDNWHVKAGDLLVELDPRDEQAALDQAKAAEAAARGKLAQAQTQVQVAQAKIGEAEAMVTVARTNAENADRDYQRFMALDPRARSQQQIDNATAAQRSSAAQVQQAQANLKAAQAQAADADQAVKTAQADVAKAAADVLRAQLNLGYCQIVAPVEGIVTRKNVEPGQYVQVAQPMFSIVPTDVWVTANFKETQLDHMRVGQPVDIKVDAYSELKLHGKVDSIQNGTGQRFTLLPPENATGNYVKVVQRVPVKVVFDPGELAHAHHLLAPGLSVTPKVHVR